MNTHVLHTTESSLDVVLLEEGHIREGPHHVLPDQLTQLVVLKELMPGTLETHTTTVSISDDHYQVTQTQGYPLPESMHKKGYYMYVQVTSHACLLVLLRYVV